MQGRDDGSAGINIKLLRILGLGSDDKEDPCPDCVDTMERQRLSIHIALENIKLSLT